MPKDQTATMIASVRQVTGASQNDAARLVKKYKSVEAAIGAFYDDPVMQANSASAKSGSGKEKKLGEIWERFRDTDPDVKPPKITIEGTLQLCEELGIEPDSDSVIFCLAHDCGSKAVGEFEKAGFISGWAALPGEIDSIEKMKGSLSYFRNMLNSDPVYFKKVYMSAFELTKASGARVVDIENGIGLWTMFIPPALASSPSALARVPPGQPPSSPLNLNPPSFTKKHFDIWIEYQRGKGKAVTKDTWSLFVDFIRTIDADFKEYDEEAAWPSSIDDFVELVRSKK